MPNIFLAEDDLDLSNIIRDSLEAQSHSLDNVSNGHDAIETLLSKRYDLIILDWDLAEGPTGPEVCKAFRDAGGTTPVIMLTGRSGLHEKETGLESGADDYLTKPFQMRELNARIKAMLRRSSTYSAQTTTTIGPGQIIADKYVLKDKIGQGGMATVWKATHTGIGKEVVIKIMLPHADAGVNRFQQECRIMARVTHPNVITIYDAGSLNQRQPFMVMEYIRGESLGAMLDREGAISLHLALEILLQLCSGLEAAHKAGIIHRDLKPDNILLQERTSRADWVKIVDFGIARLTDSMDKLTSEGVVVGTLEYMAPEQLEGKAADERSDIYAVTVLFFEMITGLMPFEGENTRAHFIQQLFHEPRLPSQLRKDMPPGGAADKLVSKGLARLPENRYQSVADLAVEVKQILDLLPASAVPANEEI